VPTNRSASRWSRTRCSAVFAALAAEGAIDPAWLEQWVPEDQAPRWIPVPNCAEILGVDRGLARAQEQIRALFGLGERAGA